MESLAYQAVKSNCDVWFVDVLSLLSTEGVISDQELWNLSYPSIPTEPFYKPFWNNR